MAEKPFRVGGGSFTNFSTMLRRPSDLLPEKKKERPRSLPATKTFLRHDKLLVATVELNEDSEASTPVDSPKTPIRVLGSSFRRSLTSLGGSGTTLQVASDEMNEIAAAIVTHKKKLLNALVALDGDFAVRVRFVDAVDQFLLEDLEAKQKAMGLKLISLFFPDEPGECLTSTTACTRERFPNSRMAIGTPTWARQGIKS